MVRSSTRSAALQMACVQCDPAFTIFLPFICPWIPAILATSVLPDLAQAARELRQVGLILAISLSIVAVGFVPVPDLRRSPVQPFMLRSVDAAAQIDARLRKPLRDDYRRQINSPFADDEQKSAMKALGVQAACARASWIGRWAVLLNSLTSVVVACFFASVITVSCGIQTNQLGKLDDVEPLLIATACF